jgi:hypothetical protein
MKWNSFRMGIVPTVDRAAGDAPPDECQLPWLEVDARLEGVELVAAVTDDEVSVGSVVVVVVGSLTELVASSVVE